MLKRFQFMLLTVLLSPVIASGATYYVSTTGNDVNQGTQTSPWRTITKAANMMVGGDTAIVDAGTYNEKVTTARSGNAGNRITFRAMGAVVTKTFNVTQNYITIDGFEMTGANEGYMMPITGSYCEIINNTIHDTGASWGIIHIASDATTGCVIRNNRYYSSTGPGDDLAVIILSGNNNVAEYNEIGPAKDIDAFRVWGTNNTVRNNYIHDASPSAGSSAHLDVIQTFGLGGATSLNIVFEKNLIVNFDGQICMTEYNGSGNMHDWDVRDNVYVNVGMQANIGIPYFRFTNNTLYNVGATNNLVMYLYDAAGKSNYSNAQIVNNLFITAGSIGNYGQVMAVGNTGSNITIDYNYVAKINGFGALSGFSEAHGVNGGDPQFVNPSSNNFHLLSNSPAINNGATLAWFNYDYDGVARPQGGAWDIGAFEFAAGQQQQPLPPTNLRVNQ